MAKMKKSRSSISHGEVLSLSKQGMTPRQIANTLKVSRVKVKRILSRIPTPTEPERPSGIIIPTVEEVFRIVGRAKKKARENG